MGCGGSKSAKKAQEPQKNKSADLLTEGQVEQGKADKPTELVKVEILSAKDLRVADRDGKSEPYCIVEIVGKPESKLQTPVHADPRNPEWNAPLRIPGFGPGDTISVTIKDKDPIKPDDILGQVELTEKQLRAGLDNEELKLAKVGEGIQATLKLTAQIEAPKRAKVDIVSASGLRDADWFGQNEPYCIVEIIGKPESKRETAIHKDGKNPEWNATFEIPGLYSHDKLLFTVKDKDTVKDDILGIVEISEEQLASGGVDAELGLSGKPAAKETAEDTAAPAEAAAAPAEGAAVPAEGAAEGAAAAEGKAPATLKVKVCVEEPKPIKVEVISAKNLRDTDFMGTSEPYCIVEIVGKPESKRETVALKEWKNPEWNATLEVPGFCSWNSLAITIKDKDPLKPDDILGKLELSPEQLKAGVNEEIKLSGVGEGSDASLKVKVEATESVVEQIADAVGDAIQAVAEAVGLGPKVEESPAEQSTGGCVCFA